MLSLVIAVSTAAGEAADEVQAALDAARRQAARFEGLLAAQAARLEHLERQVAQLEVSTCSDVHACVQGVCTASVAIGMQSCFPQNPCSVTCRADNVEASSHLLDEASV